MGSRNAKCVDSNQRLRPNDFSASTTRFTICSVLHDPDFRRQLLSEDPIAESTFPLIERLSYKYMFRFGDPRNYLPREQDSIAAIAAGEGRTASEVAYDVMLEDEGHETRRSCMGYCSAPVL